MKYIKISIVILLVSFISIFAYKLATNKSNNKISLTKEQMKDMLSYTIDGNKTSSMPSKGSGYIAKSITCNNGSILTWDNDNWLLEVEKLESEDICNIDFTTGTGSYTVTAVPSIDTSLDSTSKTTTENGQVVFYTKLVVESVTGCNSEINKGRVIVKDVTGNTTCNINYKATLASEIISKSLTNTDGVYNENGYRYEGSNPNNYIYMVNNGTKELWRIVGLFPDGANGEYVIRVRKKESTTDAYDSNSTNHWPNTTLYSTLSGTYTLANYSNAVNFKMYLGTKSSYQSLTTDGWYNVERGNTPGYTSLNSYNSVSTFTGSVGLIYPSDYGYAALASDCDRSTELYSYDGTSTCFNNNWLYNSSWQWIITPGATYADYAFDVDKGGYVGNSYVVTYQGAYFPVMALSNDVVVTGTGTESDPYVMN